MNLMAWQGSIELGIIYGFMALGIFVSFRILNIPDLTVDGSFTLGASCSAIITLAGHPFLGLLAGALAGAIAGLITAFLQTKMKIQPILAGILTMTGLCSINLRIMQKRGNVSLLNIPTVFDPMKQVFGDYAKLLFPLLLIAVVILAMTLFFKTQLGLSIRATGDNEDMVRSSSINADFTKTVGLSLGNAIVGLSGALIAQYQQFSDINMGIGMVVIAMASLIIGEVLLFLGRSLQWHIISVVIGSIFYRLIIMFVLNFNPADRLSPYLANAAEGSFSHHLLSFVIQYGEVSTSDLKLISSIIVGLALSYPVIKDRMEIRKLRKAGEQNATTH